MDKSRRCFLGIAGGALIGGVPVARALAESAHDPASSANAGKQWAMVIDTKKCQQKGECTACSDACHLAHNVPTIADPEEEIKWLWKENYHNVFPDQGHKYDSEALLKRPVLVLCNHCERPACTRVCPTKATWRRESDGVVMMDMHRCVGCRYCMTACPYGARSFNWSNPRPHIKEINKEFPTRSMGVPEKCNFCAERLAVGKGPVCVEASERVGCNALVFGDVADPNSGVAQLLRSTHTIRRKPGLGTQPQVYYIV